MKWSETYFVPSLYCSVKNDYDSFQPSSEKTPSSIGQVCAWPVHFLPYRFHLAKLIDLRLQSSSDLSSYPNNYWELTDIKSASRESVVSHNNFLYFWSQCSLLTRSQYWVATCNSFRWGVFCSLAVNSTWNTIVQKFKETFAKENFGSKKLRKQNTVSFLFDSL